MEPEMGMLGEIKMFAGTFAPRGWEFCHGQHLQINSENQALFVILGTTYGGDGRKTFALPDFRGRVPRGEGKGPRLSEVKLAETEGKERLEPEFVKVAKSTVKDGVSISSLSINESIINPYIGMNYIICVEGSFPSRNY